MTDRTLREKIAALKFTRNTGPSANAYNVAITEVLAILDAHTAEPRAKPAAWRVYDMTSAPPAGVLSAGFPRPHEYLFPADKEGEARGTAARERGKLQPLYAAAAQPAPDAVAGTDAWRDVLAERQRQISAEGWTPEHDDAHASGEIARAAATYAIAGGWPDQAERAVMDEFGDSSATPHRIQAVWPWSREWWKPTDRRRDLVKAGALILAEIERLDRIAKGPSA